MGLHECGQQLVDKAATALQHLGVDAQLAGLLAQGLVIKRFQVDATAFFQFFAQANPLPWRREIDDVISHGHLGGAVDLDRDGGDHILDHDHHVVVIGVGLVALQQREFRVMVLVDALVPEDPADLVDLIEPADDQPLEVELGGDAQVELLVQRVVVGDEGFGVGPGGHGHQYGVVHFQEAPVVQEPADAADNLGAQDKDRHDLFVVGD